MLAQQQQQLIRPPHQCSIRSCSIRFRGTANKRRGASGATAAAAPAAPPAAAAAAPPAAAPTGREDGSVTAAGAAAAAARPPLLLPLLAHQARQLAAPGAGAAARAVCLPLLAHQAQQLAAPGAAAAGRAVCVELPDAVADLVDHPVAALLHSPPVAAGALVLALLAVPKLVRAAVRWLALPAVVALGVWLLLDHPDEAAGGLATTLLFVKAHPTLSAAVAVGLAGVALGPDLLFGAAVSGIALLLASQAGLLTLPQPPRPPQLLPPAQQAAVTRQLQRVGSAVQRRALQLDDDAGRGGGGGRSGSGSKQQQEAQRDGE